MYMPEEDVILEGDYVNELFMVVSTVCRVLRAVISHHVSWCSAFASVCFLCAAVRSVSQQLPTPDRVQCLTFCSAQTMSGPVSKAHMRLAGAWLL